MENIDELVSFFKALSDPNRLKIVGLLAQQSYTVEQLAAILGVGASTVSHHLSKLSEVGLVSAQAQGYYSVYRLEAQVLESKAKRLLARETFPAVTEDMDMQAFDRKVVRDYLLPDGRLKTIPSQRKKLLAILRHIARDFEPGERYSEKQVNEMLARYHEDTASLRREMVGSRLMAREGGGGDYWRIDEPEPAL